MKSVALAALLLLSGCASKMNVSGHIVFSYNENVKVISESLHMQATGRQTAE